MLRLPPPYAVRIVGTAIRSKLNPSVHVLGAKNRDVYQVHHCSSSRQVGRVLRPSSDTEQSKEAGVGTHEKYTMAGTPIELSDELREKLEEVNDMLAPSLDDPDVDTHRGVDVQAARLRMVAPSNARRRKINNNVARAALNRLLFQRHALQHGYEELRDMAGGNVLASSLIGETSLVKITLEHAKKIIKEEFRFRKSPLLEDYMRKHEAAKQRASLAKAKQKK